MTDEIQWSDLRLHDGGECPVGPDDVVRCLIHTNVEDRLYWNATECFARYRIWPRVIAYQVQIKPQRKMIVPWHVLPPEYRWAARDEDGDACTFRGEPVKGQSVWAVGLSETGFIRIDQLVGYDPGTKPWDQSLIQRPEGV